MQSDGVRWLNNLVAELVNLRSLPSPPRVDRTFNHPRDGWLLLRGTFTGNGKVWTGVDAETQGDATILYTRTAPKTQEAMRFLPAGEHTITVMRLLRSRRAGLTETGHFVPGFSVLTAPACLAQE